MTAPVRALGRAEERTGLIESLHLGHTAKRLAEVILLEQPALTRAELIATIAEAERGAGVFAGAAKLLRQGAPEVRRIGAQWASAVDPRQQFFRAMLGRRRYEIALSRDIEDLLMTGYKRMQDALATDYATLTAFQKKRIASLYQRLDRIVRSIYDQVERRTDAELMHYALLQSQFAERVIQYAAQWGGMEIDTTVLTRNQLRYIVQYPIHGAPLSAWWKTQGENIAFRVKQEVQLGLLRGLPTDEIARRLIPGAAWGPPGVVVNVGTDAAAAAQAAGLSFLTARRQMTAVLRTAITSISAHTQRETFAQQPAEVVEEYRYTAVLDDRTTITCATLDGKIFRLDDENAPMPPMHINCRSTIVPLVKWQQLTGGKLPDDLTKAYRASMGGPVTMQTYEEWLKTQPPEVAIEVLGPTRANLWQAGKLSLGELVDTEYRPFTLRDLESYLGLDRGALKPIPISEPVTPPTGPVPDQRAADFMPRSYDQPSYSQPPEVTAAMRQWEDDHIDERYETAITYDAKTGAEVWEKTDYDPMGVSWGNENRRQLLVGSNEGRHWMNTHNHPNGSPMSDADQLSAISHFYDETRAAGAKWIYHAWNLDHVMGDPVELRQMMAQRAIRQYQGDILRAHDEIVFPFRQQFMTEWENTWNRLKADYFGRRGLFDEYGPEPERPDKGRFGDLWPDLKKLETRWAKDEAYREALSPGDTTRLGSGMTGADFIEVELAHLANVLMAERYHYMYERYLRPGWVEP